MKKSSKFLMVIFFIFVFFASYNFDAQANSLIKVLRAPFLDFILGIATNFGVAILIMLLLPSLILYKKNKDYTHALWIGFAVSFILAFVVKLIVLRQRPVEAFNFPFTNIINYSFPSMHSMVVFALLPILIKSMPRQKYFWLIFAFLASFSRIYFGFHFLSDVIFGGFAGYLIGNYIIDLQEKGKLWRK